MNELRARKDLLLVQSDLHRQLLAAELAQARERSSAARAALSRGRWLLLGGVLLVGVLAVRRWRTLAALLPTAIATARALRG